MEWLVAHMLMLAVSECSLVFALVVLGGIWHKLYKGMVDERSDFTQCFRSSLLLAHFALEGIVAMP